jgi:hypothetical protein
MSTDVFETARSHPADAARMLAIHEMPRIIADSAETLEVQTRWQELLATIGAIEPQFFRIAYPETLTRELAKQASELFETLVLRRYTAKMRFVR